MDITINMAKTTNNHNIGLNESPQNLEVLILHKTSEMQQKCETYMGLPACLTATSQFYELLSTHSTEP
jgi:hypothetical protein